MQYKARLSIIVLLLSPLLQFCPVFVLYNIYIFFFRSLFLCINAVTNERKYMKHIF